MAFLPPVAVITHPYLGWGTVRQRWRALLPQAFETPGFFSVEDFPPAGPASFLASSPALRLLLGARRAQLAARAAGYRRFLIAPTSLLPLLNLRQGESLAAYGDATPRQYDSLYNRSLRSPLKYRFYDMRTRRLACAGGTFLCMSGWYERGLVAELALPSLRTAIVEPAVDTDLWTPPSEKAVDPFRVLFIGGDFERKGGPTLAEVASRPEFRDVRFDFVTSRVVPSPENCHFHLGVAPDSPPLLDLARKAHVFALPTRADCTPNAIIECRSAGLPIVSSPVGGVPDLVADAENGMLVGADDADALARALSTYRHDPDLARSHGLAGRRRALAANSFSVHLDGLARPFREG